MVNEPLHPPARRSSQMSRCPGWTAPPCDPRRRRGRLTGIGPDPREVPACRGTDLIGRGGVARPCRSGRDPRAGVRTRWMRSWLPSNSRLKWSPFGCPEPPASYIMPPSRRPAPTSPTAQGRGRRRNVSPDDRPPPILLELRIGRCRFAIGGPSEPARCFRGASVRPGKSDGPAYGQRAGVVAAPRRRRAGRGAEARDRVAAARSRIRGRGDDLRGRRRSSARGDGVPGLSAHGAANASRMARLHSPPRWPAGDRRRARPGKCHRAGDGLGG